MHRFQSFTSRSRLLLLALAPLAACVDGGETPRIAQSLVDAVQVSKTEPGGNCRSMGALEGRSDDEEETIYEAAYETLRTNAALRGGNYVVIDNIEGPHFVSASYYETSVVIRGRLFACTLAPPFTVRYPVAAPASIAPQESVATASASGACDPECSPNFVCVRGQCTSACNPPCSAGAECGEDRICH